MGLSFSFHYSDLPHFPFFFLANKTLTYFPGVMQSSTQEGKPMPINKFNRSVAFIIIVLSHARAEFREVHETNLLAQDGQ